MNHTYECFPGRVGISHPLLLQLFRSLSVVLRTTQRGWQEVLRCDSVQVPTTTVSEPHLLGLVPFGGWFRWFGLLYLFIYCGGAIGLSIIILLLSSVFHWSCLFIFTWRELSLDGAGTAQALGIVSATHTQACPHQGCFYLLDYQLRSL